MYQLVVFRMFWCTCTHKLENMNQKSCQPKYKKPPAAKSAKTFRMLIVVCTLVAKYNPSMSRYSHGADNWIHATMNSIYLFFCLLHARGLLFWIMTKINEAWRGGVEGLILWKNLVCCTSRKFVIMGVGWLNISSKST